MTRLQIAPGEGLVVRLAQALLFVPGDPAAATALIAGFSASPPAGALDAVTALADERELDVAPFLVAEWSDVLRLAVFGPIEVTSDHRSLPRLSGAGSGTWVERTVRGGRVTIGVAGHDVHRLSDVRLGTVPAGGFVLAVSLGGAPSPAPSEAASSEAALAEAALADVASFEAAPAERPGPAQPDPPPEAPEAHAGADAQVQPGTHIFDAMAGRDDPTLDVPDGFIDQYDATDRASGGAPPPARWTLRFVDGPLEAVDQTLVIGRRPTADDADPGPKPVRVIQLDCPQMSARHLAVWADAVGLWVTDLNSRNRSWVVTSGDHRLVALEPNVPTRLEDGTHVQIGTKVFVAARD